MQRALDGHEKVEVGIESPFRIGKGDAQIRPAGAATQDRSAEVIEAALTKVRDEQRILDEISQGLSSTAAFTKYGIL